MFIKLHIDTIPCFVNVNQIVAVFPGGVSYEPTTIWVSTTRRTDNDIEVDESAPEVMEKIAEAEKRQCLE